jgi:hypothetical protein
MFILVFLCCAVLWRQRLCDGLIPPSRESYQMSNWFIIMKWNRSQLLICKIWRWWWFITDLFDAVNSSDYCATVLSDRMINEQWIGNDVEGRSRGLISGTILALAYRDCRKPQEKSVGIAGLWIDTWTRDLPNTKRVMAMLINMTVTYCPSTRYGWEHNIKSILKCIVWGRGLGSPRSGLGSVVASCAKWNETLGSIKCEIFINQPRKDSEPRIYYCFGTYVADWLVSLVNSLWRWSCRKGETTYLNFGHQWTSYSSPR